MDTALSTPPAPARYKNSAIPHLMIADAPAAVEFYKKAFGAEEIMRVADLSGSIIHSEIRIGRSILMLGDPDERFTEPGAAGGTTVGIHIYVDDIDRLYRRAVEAGAQVLQEPQDMFYGDRMTMLQDAFGHIWVLLQPQEQLEPSEIEDRARKLFQG